MVEHGLLRRGDNTRQQILFHIMPRYIVSTIILNQKSKIRQKCIVSFDLSHKGPHLQLLQGDQRLVEKLLRIPSYQSARLSKPVGTKGKVSKATLSHHLFYMQHKSSNTQGNRLLHELTNSCGNFIQYDQDIFYYAIRLMGVDHGEYETEKWKTLVQARLTRKVQYETVFVTFNSNVDGPSPEKLPYLSHLGNIKKCHFAVSHIQTYHNILL